MGILDKLTYRLTCPKCANTEARTLLDKGNRWSGSLWPEGAVFSTFETTWIGGENREPKLQKMRCKKCNCSEGVTVTHP